MAKVETLRRTRVPRFGLLGEDQRRTEAAWYYFSDDDPRTPVCLDYRRDSSNARTYSGMIDPVFGTENNLLSNRDNPQSCQCSSAVWCKYSLNLETKPPPGLRDEIVAQEPAFTQLLELP